MIRRHAVLRQSVDNDRPSPVTVVASPKASLNCRRSCAHVDLFLRASCSGPRASGDHPIS